MAMFTCQQKTSVAKLFSVAFPTLLILSTFIGLLNAKPSLEVNNYDELLKGVVASKAGPSSLKSVQALAGIDDDYFGDGEGGETDVYGQPASTLNDVADVVADVITDDESLLYPSDFRSTSSESYFDLEASSDVDVVVGQSAFLVCRVAVSGNWTVSWLRACDINLLTVGTDTYTPDLRFRGLHVPNSPDWTLQIKATTLEDAGEYECQLSSTPLRTHVVRLRVIEPHIRIVNGPDVHVHEGSMLNLTCVISPAVDASLLLWSRNGQVLNWMYQHANGLDARIDVFDGRMWVDGGGVPVDEGNEPASQESDKTDSYESTGERESRSATVSQLLVSRAQMFHSGRYVCSAIGATGTWTMVHILADEQPAAMQRGNPASSFHHPLLAVWMALTVCSLHRYLSSSRSTQ